MNLHEFIPLLIDSGSSLLLKMSHELAAFTTLSEDLRVLVTGPPISNICIKQKIDDNKGKKKVS